MENETSNDEQEVSIPDRSWIKRGLKYDEGLIKIRKYDGSFPFLDLLLWEVLIS